MGRGMRKFLKTHGRPKGCHRDTCIPASPTEGSRNAEMENFHGIFEFEYIDINDDDNKVFSNVKFLKDIGKYKAGDEFESAYWKTDELTLYIGDDTVGIKFGLIPIF